MWESYTKVFKGANSLLIIFIIWLLIDLYLCKLGIPQSVMFLIILMIISIGLSFKKRFNFLLEIIKSIYYIFCLVNDYGCYTKISYFHPTLSISKDSYFRTSEKFLAVFISVIIIYIVIFNYYLFSTLTNKNFVIH